MDKSMLRLKLIKNADDAITEFKEKSYSIEQVYDVIEYWMKEKPYLFCSKKLLDLVVATYPEILSNDLKISLTQLACHLKVSKEAFDNILSTFQDYDKPSLLPRGDGYEKNVYPLDEAIKNVGMWYLIKLYQYGARTMSLIAAIDECMTYRHEHEEEKLIYLIEHFHELRNEFGNHEELIIQITHQGLLEKIINRGLTKTAFLLLDYCKKMSDVIRDSDEGVNYYWVSRRYINSLFNFTVSVNAELIPREILKQFDVDVNFLGHKNSTSLAWAYFNKNFELAELLISAGADPDFQQPNAPYPTPAHIIKKVEGSESELATMKPEEHTTDIDAVKRADADQAALKADLERRRAAEANIDFSDLEESGALKSVERTAQVEAVDNILRTVGITNASLVDRLVKKLG